MNKRPENHFWKKPQSTVTISAMRLTHFLTHHGFGLFQLDKKRTSGKDLFHNDNGILRIHSAQTCKTWIRKYLEVTDESEFENGKKFDCGDDADKWDVLEKFQTYSQLDKHVIPELPVFADEDFPDTERLKLFSDSNKVAHVRFRNGVVKITANDINILPIDALKDEGAVWESMLLPYDIQIDNEKGVFEVFAEKAMSRRNFNKNDDDWTKNYDLHEEEYDSMKRSFGYLLHTYNAPDTQKCVMWIDADSDQNKSEGGNGKSFIMEQVRRFKSHIFVDGKRFRNSMSDGGRFQFANVTAETKFIWIDDVQPAFPFEMIFSMITGEMEIEKKRENMMTIPRDRKPKFGLTTNYALPQFGVSYTRRQHICEFGNYWNHANKINEKPSEPKHLGKMLFEDDFTEKDWNQFFSFGFKCIQQYFQEGLVQSEHSNYETKARKVAIEGQGGDGTVANWMENWCEEERVKGNWHMEGIYEEDLLLNFAKDNPEELPPMGVWNNKHFQQKFFEFVDLHPDYDYNPQNASKGKGKSARRWKKGTAGNQKPAIKVTSLKK